ncbi:MAG TPA: hypothetical protein VG603_04680 [Chitinophagales bacterium]|nr:hypothetical protein [Chitinophagales bacterium]
MKKLFQIVIIIVFTVPSAVFAGAPANNNLSYSTPDNELSFSVNQNSGKVTLQVVMKNMGQYDKVVFEKSVGQPDNFVACQTVLCGEQLKYGRHSIYGSDKSVTGQDVYYRVKTVSKEGIERMYAPIMLPAAK